MDKAAAAVAQAEEGGNANQILLAKTALKKAMEGNSKAIAALKDREGELQIGYDTRDVCKTLYGKWWWFWLPS